MSRIKTKKKIHKGDFGYFTSEKKRQALITVVLFAVPLFIFFTAWIYHHSRMTIWTVIAVVGCLPACRSMVNLIMILMRRPMDRALYQEISAHSGKLVMAYEMYVTFYEKSAGVDAFAICGNEMVGYSTDPKIDVNFMTREIQKIIRKNGYKVNVKIMKERKAFVQRLDSLNEHYDSLHEGIKFVPDERYPDLSRDELIKHTLLAICL